MSTPLTEHWLIHPADLRSRLEALPGGLAARRFGDQGAFSTLEDLAKRAADLAAADEIVRIVLPQLDAETFEHLHKALAGLTPQQAEAIHLYAFEEQPLDVIAALCAPEPGMHDEVEKEAARERDLQELAQQVDENPWHHDWQPNTTLEVDKQVNLAPPGDGNEGSTWQLRWSSRVAALDGRDAVKLSLRMPRRGTGGEDRLQVTLAVSDLLAPLPDGWRFSLGGAELLTLRPPHWETDDDDVRFVLSRTEIPLDEELHQRLKRYSMQPMTLQVDAGSTRARVAAQPAADPEDTGVLKPTSQPANAGAAALAIQTEITETVEPAVSGSRWLDAVKRVWGWRSGAASSRVGQPSLAFGRAAAFFVGLAVVLGFWLQDRSRLSAALREAQSNQAAASSQLASERALEQGYADLRLVKQDLADGNTEAFQDRFRRLRVVKTANIPGQDHPSVMPTLHSDAVSSAHALAQASAVNQVLRERYEAYLEAWAKFLQSLGAILAQSGKVNEAIAVVQYLADQHASPQNEEEKVRLAERLIDLAEFQKIAGDHRAAIATLRRAGGLVPRDPRPAHYIGWSHYQLGENEAALQAYARALVLDPQYAKVYYNRSLIYRDRGDLRRANDDLERALNLTLEAYRQEGDANPRVTFTLAVIYASTGQLASALDYLERALLADRIYVFRAVEEPAFGRLKSPGGGAYHLRYRELLERYQRPVRPRFRE